MASQLSSGDILADRRYRYAEACLDEGDHAAAADLAEQVLEITPRYAPAWLLLGRAREKALERGLPTSLFTADLFATGGDAENRAAVAAVRGADLDLVGLAVHGPKNAVDKLTKGARMHA